MKKDIQFTEVAKKEFEKEFIAEIIDTYKSKWYISKLTGNWMRVQKNKYPFDFVDKISKFRLVKSIRKLSTLFSMLGHKSVGEEFYSYYDKLVFHFVNTGDMGKWHGEFEKVILDLEMCNINIIGKSCLDISGEPGFFAKLLSDFAEVTLTSYSKKVADVINNLLGVECIHYDFNKDYLPDIFPKKFDIIFLRWCIGFRIDIISLINELNVITSENAYIYLQYSPPSRGLALRWMFEDYTYLKLWNIDFLVGVFNKFGFSLVYKKNEGSYRWDKNIHIIQKLFSFPYALKILKQQPHEEENQHNYTLIFRKI